MGTREEHPLTAADAVPGSPGEPIDTPASSISFSDADREDPDRDDSRQEDEEWIGRILATRSSRAADDLVRKYYDDILAYIRVQVGEREETMNLTQETFIAALRSLGNYDPVRSGFRTWLHRIATYKVIDYWRARRRQSRRNTWEEWGPLDAETTDPSDRALDEDLVRRIENRVSGAPIRAQEVFRLHLYGGYGFVRIARMNGEPEATVKARYYRLLEGLRKEFGHERL